VNNSAKNQQPAADKQPKEGISNHNLQEEQERQAKVLPFRERADKKETDQKAK
jgi:hypothetical protein